VGVTPDLATIGKCAGGGLPVGALLGRAELFRALGPDAGADRAFRHAGTWNANPLAAAGGVAACSLYLDGEPQRQARTSAKAFRDGANEMLSRMGISGRLYGRSVVHLYLGAVRGDAWEPDYEAPSTAVAALVGTRFGEVTGRLNTHLLQRGVASLGGSLFVFSAAHGAEDVADTLQRLDDSLRAMLSEGSMPAELRRG